MDVYNSSPSPALAVFIRPCTVRQGNRRVLAQGRLQAHVPAASEATNSRPGGAGKAALRNSSQAALGLRLSGKALMSASETTVYKLIKFLPLSARMLLDVLESVSRLQKLVNVYGGTVVRVPLRKWSSEAPLVTVLGVRAMKRFVAVYGGTDVYIPTCSDFLRRLRDVHICREFARMQRQDMPNRQIIRLLCGHYALSENRIRTIVRAGDSS